MERKRRVSKAGEGAFLGKQSLSHSWDQCQFRHCSIRLEKEVLGVMMMSSIHYGQRLSRQFEGENKAIGRGSPRFGWNSITSRDEESLKTPEDT